MPEAREIIERPSGPLEVESPIINSPFYAPRFHWQIRKGQPPLKAEGRRPASYYFRVPEHAQRGRRQVSARSTPLWTQRFQV